MSGLAALAAYPQFILWKAIPKSNGKTDKFPCDPLGNPANAHNPAIWLSQDEARTRAATLGLGVGFVFTEQDPFFFIDIDNCLEATGWNATAQALCHTFQGACVEVSQSGTGLHIIGKYSSLPEHRCKGLGHDLYTSSRFVALTYRDVIGDANTDHTGALAAHIVTHLAPMDTGGPDGLTDGPVPEWNGPTDDEELIRKALQSSSGRAVFGDGVTFKDLWEANPGALGKRWPDDHGSRPFDHSAADAALCSQLAFWTGKDGARIDRIFRLSRLMRDKWEERPDYRERTITGAIGACTNVYSKGGGSPPLVPPSGEEGEGRPANGAEYLQAHKQTEYFKGCVYVRDLHRVFVPDGALLRQDQFRAAFGGYIFGLDRDFNKTTRSAFEAFTESLAVKQPKVHLAAFRPELPPGLIFEEGGHPMVNTYVPEQVACIEGDVTPFWDLLCKLLPDPGDLSILLAWMAALVQYPGVKFQWAPLLQGVEGNGKTAILGALGEAVGWTYTFLPNAKELDNKFTGWLSRKLLIGVEEIKVRDRWEVMEAMKPLITNLKIEIQHKGADQVLGDNRANFFMCSNHRDAILKGRSDRRYCVFYTAQQDPEDLLRDGMGGHYFHRLYSWLRSGGYAHVTHWLRNYPIPPELNPAGECQRAPVTTSTKEAVALSMGGVEQEILAAVEEERPGFRGGWVSSIAVDNLISAMKGRGVSRNKRRGILQALGYERHPSLPDGRSPRATQLDGGRPRLYVERGGTLWSNGWGLDPKSVVKAYEKAQSVQ